jgi:hypothetical protein
VLDGVQACRGNGASEGSAIFRSASTTRDPRAVRRLIATARLASGGPDAPPAARCGCALNVLDHGPAQLGGRAPGATEREWLILMFHFLGRRAATPTPSTRSDLREALAAIGAIARRRPVAEVSERSLGRRREAPRAERADRQRSGAARR